jgi:predicted metal-dependent enzyme (double-stranded beta helix superfamily)
MLDLERFIRECRDAARADMPRQAVAQVVERFMSLPGEVLATVGEQRPGVHALHHSPDLTIMNVVWAPDMSFPPHDHTMWAVIGIYAGTEDNVFWQCREDGRVSRQGLVRLETRQVRVLGDRAIHSVANPHSRLTGGIHVYGGDFPNAQGRREWDPATREGRAMEPGITARRFEEACRGKELVW